MRNEQEPVSEWVYSYVIRSGDEWDTGIQGVGCVSEGKKTGKAVKTLCKCILFPVRW